MPTARIPHAGAFKLGIICVMMLILSPIMAIVLDLFATPYLNTQHGPAFSRAAYRQLRPGQYFADAIRLIGPPLSTRANPGYGTEIHGFTREGPLGDRYLFCSVTTDRSGKIISVNQTEMD